MLLDFASLNENVMSNSLFLICLTNLHPYISIFHTVVSCSARIGKNLSAEENFDI